MNNLFSFSPLSSQSSSAEIEREFEAGEKILWRGRSAPAEWKRGAGKNWNSKFAVSLFALFWIGLALQAPLKSLSYGQFPTLEEFIFPIFGLLFFGGVVYQEWFKPARLSDEAKRTFYAVTDRRALIVVTDKNGKTREVRSYAPHQIQLGRREREQNLGDILFNDARSYEREPPIRSFQLHRPEKEENELERETGFFAIENPREVEKLIRRNLLDRKI